MEFYWKCGLVQLNPILFNVTQRSLGFGGFVPPGWPALGRWLAYLSPSGDGDLPGTHEVTLTLTLRTSMEWMGHPGGGGGTPHPGAPGLEMCLDPWLQAGRAILRGGGMKVARHHNEQLFPFFVLVPSSRRVMMLQERDVR
jgi:hypothetical protein